MTAEYISGQTIKPGTTKHGTQAEQRNTGETTEQQNNTKKYYQYGLTTY